MNVQNSHSLIKLSVLPLQDLTEDKRIQMLCTGLRMDLLTDLARFRSFLILPAENLDSLSTIPDYIVKGIARFKGGMIQLNLQLIQYKENRLVWAEKFGDTLENLFKIEEEILSRIVVSLQQNVDFDLLSQIRKRPLTDLNAYEKWLYGMEELKKGTVEADEKARTFFQGAIDLDSSFAKAYTGMSLTYFNEWSCLLWDKWEEYQSSAISWALQAVELDAYDSQNYFILGKCYLFYKQYAKAEHFLRKALEISPLNPELIVGIAFCLTYLGYTEEALQLYNKALEMDPSKGGFLLTGTFVYFENGLFKEALEIGEKATHSSEWIDFKATLAAAHFQLGQMDEMWAYWKAYTVYFQEKMRPGEPVDEAFALEWMMTLNPYKEYSQHQPFWDYIKEHLGAEFPTEGPKEKTSHSPYQFVKEDKLWRLTYKGQSIQLTDLKGLHDIVRLLQQPNSSIHCADLMDLKVFESGAPVLDEEAKRSYKQRLLEIQQSLAEAEQYQDFQKIEQLQKEYDDLIQHLSSSLGLDGQSRKISGNIEKARSAVTWRIRSAIKKIAAFHPELALHLKISIKTGQFCVYQPEQNIDWETS